VSVEQKKVRLKGSEKLDLTRRRAWGFCNIFAIVLVGSLHDYASGEKEVVK